jgi:hypothetical protein
MRRELLTAIAAVAAVLITAAVEIVAAAHWAGQVTARLEAVEGRLAAAEQVLLGEVLAPGARPAGPVPTGNSGRPPGAPLFPADPPALEDPIGIPGEFRPPGP